MSGSPRYLPAIFFFSFFSFLNNRVIMMYRESKRELSVTGTYAAGSVPALFLRKNQFRYTMGVIMVVSRLMRTSTT
jgi:hypothetical protein